MMYGQTIQVIILSVLVAALGYYIHREHEEQMNKLVEQVNTMNTTVKSLRTRIKASERLFSEYRKNVTSYKKRVKEKFSSVDVGVASASRCSQGASGSLVWAVANFTRERRERSRTKAELVSASVCRGGYEVRVNVALDGAWSPDTQGKYLSVWVYHSQGAWDDLLTWPSPYRVEVELLRYTHLLGGGQAAGDRVRAVVRPLEQRGKFGKPKQSTSADGRGRNAGVGILEFISHEDLEKGKSDYLINDTLYLRITVK